MSEPEKNPIVRRPPPAWMVAPKSQLPTPVPQALPVAPALLPVAAAVLAVAALPVAPAIAAPAIVAPVPAPLIKAGPVPRARTSGVETASGQARPWNVPDWK